MASIIETAFRESQSHFTQYCGEKGDHFGDEFLTLLSNQGRSRYSQVINEKLREWRTVKSRLDREGRPTTRNQEKNLKELFIASLPTPETRVLPRPPADQHNLVAIYEQLSTVIVPRKPRRLRPTYKAPMGINTAAMARAGAGAKKMKSPIETTVMPISPGHTSAGDSDEEMGEDEETVESETPPPTQDKSKKKTPVAKTTKKPASAIPAKRGNEDSQEGKKEPPAKKGTPAKENNTKVESPKTSLAPVNPAPSTDPGAFATPIFDIFVGPNKLQFSAHQAILAQSPILRKLCDEQAKKKGKARTSILLLSEKPANFGALLSYLYSGQVLVTIPTDANGNLKTDGDGVNAEAMAKSAQKLAKLYCVGASYEMNELQRFITKKLESTMLWEKLPGMDFFELAERLYPDDGDDAESDSFARFFAVHAPKMIKTIPESRVYELMHMVSKGGAYAEAIFIAFSTAARAGLTTAKETPGVQAKSKVEDAASTGLAVVKESTEAMVEEKEDIHVDEKPQTEGTVEESDTSGTIGGA